MNVLNFFKRFKPVSGSRKMQGPYPVFCRGHSGGRLVCEAFIRNHIDMGYVAADRKDTEFFVPENNPLMREIVLNAYQYPEADSERKRSLLELTRHCVDEYLKAEIHTSGPFGWKLGVSIFSMLMVLDAFPSAKAVHLIRDGRDVMLSRLDARFGNLADSLNRLAVFGDADADNFNGRPLNAETVAACRNEMEMLHWVTAVEYGLKGRAYKGRYLEVKYEDICRDPIPVFACIFDFIGVPFLPETKAWLSETVHSGRIGKWNKLPPDKLESSLEIGKPLLERLGYL